MKRLLFFFFMLLLTFKYSGELIISISFEKDCAQVQLKSIVKQVNKSIEELFFSGRKLNISMMQLGREEWHLEGALNFRLKDYFLENLCLQIEHSIALNQFNQWRWVCRGNCCYWSLISMSQPRGLLSC